MNYLNQQRYPTYYGQDLKYFSLGDDAFEPLLESLRNAKKFIKTEKTFHGWNMGDVLRFFN